MNTCSNLIPTILTIYLECNVNILYGNTMAWFHQPWRSTFDGNANYRWTGGISHLPTALSHQVYLSYCYQGAVRIYGRIHIFPTGDLVGFSRVF